MKDSLFKYPPVSVRYLVNEKTFISLVPKNLQKVSLFYLFYSFTFEDTS